MTGRDAAMRCVFVFLAAAMLLAALGCSGVSTVEKANLTTPVAREEYANAHPGDQHNVCIRNGEITRGMSVHEVIASWGMPNVYVVSRSKPGEQWIYYLKDRDSLLLLIYTLSFADDTLSVWDIDQKRLPGQALVSTVDLPPEPPERVSPATKKR
jgi:hypothetical protein